MAPGRLAGLFQAAEEVAVHAETTRDLLLALLSFTPDPDGAELTSEAVSLYFGCLVKPASFPPHLPQAGRERSKLCCEGIAWHGLFFAVFHLYSFSDEQRGHWVSSSHA